MTNIWQRKVQELTVWKFPIEPRKEEIYNKALAYIMQQLEKLDSELFNQFDALGSIVWTKDLRDIPCENALGCADMGAGGSIYSKFFDNPYYDFFIMSMEAVHKGLADYYLDNHIPEPYTKGNDIVHLAANVMEQPYASWTTKRFRLLSDWLTLRRPIEVPIFLYNTRYLVDHTDEIMAMIKNHTAPTGANQYWAAMPDTDAKNSMLHWLGIEHHH